MYICLKCTQFLKINAGNSLSVTIAANKNTSPSILEKSQFEQFNIFKLLICFNITGM